MKLNDKYSIEKEANGFSLVEKTSIEIKKDGKKTGETKTGENKGYYGTVYQALQGFINATVDDNVDKEVSELFQCVNNALLQIDAAKKYIKSEFCIEVKRC